MSRQPEWTVVLLGTSLSIVCGLGRGDWAVRYQTVLRCNCPVGVPSFASPFHNKRVTGHRAEGRPTKSELRSGQVPHSDKMSPTDDCPSHVSRGVFPMSRLMSEDPLSHPSSFFTPP